MSDKIRLPPISDILNPSKLYDHPQVSSPMQYNYSFPMNYTYTYNNHNHDHNLYHPHNPNHPQLHNLNQHQHHNTINTTNTIDGTNLGLSPHHTSSITSPNPLVVNHRSSGKRKTRNNLPKETTYILLKWLNDHLNHPYPNSFEKNQLMMSTGLNQQQLSNWFINARRRKIKTLKEQKRMNLIS